MGASASFGGFGVTFSLTDEFSSVADTIRSKFKQLDHSTSNIVETVNAGMSQIAAGAAVAGIGLAALAPVYMAINKASDLQESMTKNNVIFGDSIGYINDFVKESAISYGLSDNAAYAAIGTYGNLFTALGLGQKQAGEYSVTLTKLAADLASFNNTDIQSAMDALKSGLTGETMPLKKYGVAITEVLVKQQALAMGLTDNLKVDLTPVQKMQATYALIMEQTKTAQGDFIRTGDGYANMTRKISARIDNFAVKVGSVFLPIIEKASMLFEKAVSWITDFSETGMGKFAIGVGVGTLALFGFILVIIGVKMALGGVATAAWAAFAPFLPIIGIIAAIVGGLALLTGGFEELFTVIKGLSAVFQSAGKDGFSMSQELATALDEIGLLDFVVAMGTWFVRIKEFFSGMIDGLTTVYNVVATVFGVIWDIITTVVEAAVEVMSWFGIEMTNQTSSLESWATAGEIIGYVIGVVLVMALLSLLAPLYSVAVAFVAAFWFPMLIILLIVAVLWILWEVVSFVWDILKSVGAWIMDNFGPVIDGLVGAFKILGNIIKFIADALAFILKPILEAIGAIFGWLWDNCIKPLIDGIKWLWNTISEGAVSAFTTLDGFLTGLWEAISAPFVALGDFFSGLWDSIVSSFSNMLNWLGDAWDNSFLGKATSMLIDGAVNVAGTASDIATGATTFDSLVAPSNNTDGALNSLGGMNAQQAAGTAPVVNNTNSESVKSITIVQQIDSEEIAKKVIEKNEFDAARG